MKRFITFVLIIMMALAFSACGGSGGSSSNTGGGSSTGTDAPVYTLADAVIVDDENCTFTITKVEASRSGFALTVMCENKTDLNLMFSLNDVSVNGFMLDPFWAKEVAAGKIANSEVSFSSSQLEQCNITSVDEIEFTLKVYDSDDWSADDLINDVYAVYPTGLDADTVVYPEKPAVAGEQVIFDNESCTFIIETTDADNIWGYTLKCYLVNKTSDPLMFSWDNVSVNGFMIDPYWAKEVAPGKSAFSDISFSSSGFETNNITDVETIEFKLKVYNSDDWSADDILNEVFTYNP